MQVFKNLTVRLHVFIIFFMHVKSHQINVKISNFYNLKLCIKNKFIDRIVNSIQFERNLIYILKI